MRIAFLVLIIILFTTLSCDKDNQPDIPYVNVYEEIYPNSMHFISVSDYRYLNAGYRGIIVYRLSMTDFRVYERCCPYDPENPNARVIVNPDNITATDTCCGSTYLLLDGSPMGDGPSPYTLMTYNYSFDGETLRIYN